MGRPKTPERRKPANAELRSAMGALELWIRHAAVKNSGVIKVTHHELITIHDALVLALREDNPQSLLVLDTDAGTEVRKDIVDEAASKKSGAQKWNKSKTRKPATSEEKTELSGGGAGTAEADSEPDSEVLARAESDQSADLEAEIDPDLTIDLDIEADAPPEDTDSKDKA